MQASPTPHADSRPRPTLAAAKAVLPAVFLALLTFWGGSFAGGATFAGAAVAHGSLLAFALLGAARWRDPLGLGGGGRWLVPALLVAASASWLSGPVPRAGVTGLILLPAYLLIPAAVASCWRGAREQRLGLGALGLLLGLVAAVALIRWQAQTIYGAALPLGNKNLLATWLVILWPVGLASLACTSHQSSTATPYVPGLARHRLARIGAVPVGLSVVVALIATDSILAAVAIVVQALLAAMWWKRARRWAWSGIVVLVVLSGVVVVRAAGDGSASGPPAVAHAAPTGVSQGLQRVASVVSGTDPSLRRRVQFANAGWAGMSRRPLLGWGPASVPWTAGLFIEPAAGLNPASAVVGDLHFWPAQLGYEMGALGLGLVAAIAWLFARRRLQELAGARQKAILLAALLGLAGGAVQLAGTAAVAVLAVPAALAVIAGVAVACTPQVPRGTGRSALGLGCLYLLPVALFLLPLERAHLSYQRAVDAGTGDAALAHLRRAQEFDPGFPLYRARAAWLAAELGGSDADVAEEARRAALEARHLAPLWLAAGTLALDAGQPWAEDALQRARELDPLSPLPAFHLLRARPTREDAVELGVEAVSGDRRLARAVFWTEHTELQAAVLARLDLEITEPGVTTALLVQSMDTQPRFAFSPFAFRRSMWPADIAAVEVYR